MHIDTQHVAVDTSPWTGVGTVGHFVRIGSGSRMASVMWSLTAAIHARPSPATSFNPVGSAAPALFTSYALWNYLSTPFLFTRPGFELRELEPHEEGGDVWRRLLVKFPSEHSYP